MVKLVSPLRRATPGDAHALAELINVAGEGLPLYFWGKIAEDSESPWDVGRRRARRKTGGFSHMNAVVLENAGEIDACLIGYPLSDISEPTDHDQTPAIFAPLEELERLALGTWYINVLAVYPQMRGKGYGTSLLDLADLLAADAGKSGLSLIVSDVNRHARCLYEEHGYRRVADRPMVKKGWRNPSKRWLLYRKSL